MLNIAKLYDLTAVGVKDTAMRMLMTVQRERPEAVVAAIATLFLKVCQRYRVDPRQTLDITERILRDAMDKNPVEMRAINRYMREELPDA